MYQHDHQLRVKYGETDKMGVVYHGHYALYFEAGRTEALRALGITYRELEEQGVMLPVLEWHAKYFKPAFYDDLITIRTILKEQPGVRITFDYEVFRKGEELIAKGYTTLVFVDAHTRKPSTPSSLLMDKLQPFFNA